MQFNENMSDTTQPFPIQDGRTLYITCIQTLKYIKYEEKLICIEEASLLKIYVRQEAKKCECDLF